MHATFPLLSMSNGQSNTWFAISMGLVGLIVGYGLATALEGGVSSFPIPTQVGQPTVDDTTPPPSNDTPATVDDDPVLGKADAPVTIIEFTDFQCPFCSRHFTQTFGEIKKNYIDTGKVKYVLRDFPLGFHPNAQKSAEAAECADEQGKFWEMHDALFLKQNEWSNLSPEEAGKKFKQYASDLKLNAGSFAGCLDGGTMATEVTKDQTDGSAAGIDGTPGFWILGPDGKNQKISGAYPYDTFKTAFDSMLQ